MIQQQYYTRERKGLYSPIPGYDTIAKSAGLNDKFVKDVLHPLCIYEAPTELIRNDIKEIDKYPSAISCLNTESGELIIGQAKYVGRDYDGEDNTFFVHNYVVTGLNKDYFLQDIKRVFEIKEFKDSYDYQDGTILPEISDESLIKKSVMSSANVTNSLEKLNISEKIFKRMIYAVFMSVSNKKKILVCFNSEPSDICNYSKVLIEAIFTVIPFELRRNFGFITYIREPKNKKGINLMVTEKGSIEEGAEIRGAYIFDFSEEKFLNIDFDFRNNPFLDFAWKYKDDLKEINGFFQQADNLIRNLKLEERILIDTYSALVNLYLINIGKQNLNIEQVKIVLNSVFWYMGTNSVSDKSMLSEIINKILDGELQKNYSPIYLISMFISNIDILSSIQSEKVYKIIEKSANYNRYMNNLEYMEELVGKVFSSEKIIKELMEVENNNILLSYVKYRIDNVQSFDDLENEIGRLNDVDKVLSNQEYVFNSLEEKFVELFKNSKINLNNCRNVFAKINYCSVNYKNMKKVVNKIYNRLCQMLLQNINFEEIQPESILTLKKIKDTSVFYSACEETKKRIIEALLAIDDYDIDRITPSQYLGNMNKIIIQLDEGDKKVIEKIMKKLYLTDLENHRYGRLMVPYKYLKGEGNQNNMLYNIMSNIHEGYGKEEVFCFISWYADNLYNDFPEDCFVENVKMYVVKECPKAFEDKSLTSKLFQSQNKELFKLLDVELAKGPKAIIKKTVQLLGKRIC